MRYFNFQFQGKILRMSEDNIRLFCDSCHLLVQQGFPGRLCAWCQDDPTKILSKALGKKNILPEGLEQIIGKLVYFIVQLFFKCFIFNKISSHTMSCL